MLRTVCSVQSGGDALQLTCNHAGPALPELAKCQWQAGLPQLSFVVPTAAQQVPQEQPHPGAEVLGLSAADTVDVGIPLRRPEQVHAFDAQMSGLARMASRFRQRYDRCFVTGHDQPTRPQSARGTPGKAAEDVRARRSTSCCGGSTDCHASSSSAGHSSASPTAPATHRSSHLVLSGSLRSCARSGCAVFRQTGSRAPGTASACASCRLAQCQASAAHQSPADASGSSCWTDPRSSCCDTAQLWRSRGQVSSALSICLWHSHCPPRQAACACRSPSPVTVLQHGWQQPVDTRTGPAPSSGSQEDR